MHQELGEIRDCLPQGEALHVELIKVQTELMRVDQKKNLLVNGATVAQGVQEALTSQIL